MILIKFVICGIIIIICTYLGIEKANTFNAKKVDYCYNIGYVTTIARMKEIKDTGYSVY